MKNTLNAYYLKFCLLLVLLTGVFNTAFAIDSPAGFILKQESQAVELSWNGVSGAQGYNLYYAPYPGGTPINFIDLGNSLMFSIEIGTCAAYYVAVTAYRTTVQIDNEGNVVLDENGNEIMVYEESGFSIIQVVEAINPSFFPIYSCAGLLSNNSWNYELNQGDILIQNSSLFPADIAFNTASISVDVKNSRLNESFSAHYVNDDGSDAGSLTEDKFNDLVLSGEVRLGSQKIEIGLQQIVNNGDFNLSEIELFSTLISKPEPAVSWPLSRKDLHLLEVGSVFASSLHNDTPVNINVLFSEPVLEEKVSEKAINFESSWIMTGKMDSMLVKGKQYYNIVEVTNRVKGESVGTTGDIENLDRTSTYWLSRGVGMIKGIGQFNINNTSLLVELDSHSVQ